MWTESASFNNRITAVKSPRIGSVELVFEKQIFTGVRPKFGQRSTCPHCNRAEFRGFDGDIVRWKSSFPICALSQSVFPVAGKTDFSWE